MLVDSVRVEIRISLTKLSWLNVLWKKAITSLHFKSRTGLCLQSHSGLICLKLLCLKTHSGLYLKKANSACVFSKDLFHVTKYTSSSIYKCFCISVSVKCAVFVFVLIIVQFYTEVFLFVRTQNKETYMTSHCKHYDKEIISKI